MRVLLLGAAGFIGRHVCARLLAGGEQVVAAVRGEPTVIAGALQLALVGGYTLGLAVPALWLAPYGALLKNLPILCAIATWSALREAR